MGEVVPPPEIPQHHLVHLAPNPFQADYIGTRFTCDCGDIAASFDERDVRIHIEWALRARVEAAEADRDALQMQVNPLRWAANEMQRKARAAEAEVLRLRTALAAMLDTHVCELHDERAKSARTRARALLGATESGPPPT